MADDVYRFSVRDDTNFRNMGLPSVDESNNGSLMQVVDGAWTTVTSISNAQIDYLNAAKLTIGTLNMGRIAAKAITGAKIADGTIKRAKLDTGIALPEVTSDDNGKILKVVDGVLTAVEP